MNRRMTEQERLAARLERLHWTARADAPGYFLKGACRVIVAEGETLLTTFESDTSSRVAWEASFGPKTPFQVVMAAAMAAEGGG